MMADGDYIPYFSRQWASHRRLLRFGHLTDLHLVCSGGAVVPVHRLLLLPRSPLVTSLLAATPGSTTLLLPQVEAATVRLLLDILYSGRSAVLTLSCPRLIKSKTCLVLRIRGENLPR